MSDKVEMLRCSGCGADSVRRQGNRIIIFGIGEGEDHTALIDLKPGAAGQFTCGFCGTVDRHEYESEPEGGARE